MLVSISDIEIQDWSSGCAKKDKSPKCCTSFCLCTGLDLLNIRLRQPIYSLALAGSGASSQLTHFYLVHIIMLWDMYDFFFRLLWLCCIFAIWKTHVFVRKKKGCLCSQQQESKMASEDRAVKEWKGGTGWGQR